MTKTTIEWTDATWNPLRGCSRVSDGCRNCYAERVALRFSGPGQPYEGLVKLTAKGPTWTGQVRTVPDKLTEPLHWKTPRRVFVNSMSDLFHEAVPDEFIDQVFAVMARCPQHGFQVLTKRPERMLAFLRNAEINVRDEIKYEAAAETMRWPLPNVWLGVSVEDQATADARIPLLLATPAAVRWISAEPLLGPVDLRMVAVPLEHDQLRRPWDLEGSKFNALQDHDDDRYHQAPATLDWVVAGGESGPKARPSHPDWFRSLRDQCAAAGVDFLFKQWGEWNPGNVQTPSGTPALRIEQSGAVHPWPPGFDPKCGDWCMHKVGKKAAGRQLDGVLHDAYPQAEERNENA